MLQDQVLGPVHIRLVRALEREDDVALGARGEVELAPVATDAIVPFAAHAVGHHDDGAVPLECGHIRGADAEVPRRWSNQGLALG